MNKYRLRRIGVASNASATRPTLSDCIELVLAHVDALVGDVLDALKAPYPASGNDACVGDGANPEVKAAVMLLVTEASAVRAMFSSELRRLVYQSGSRDLGQSPLERVEDIRVFDVRELEVHIEHALARQEVIRAVDDVMPLFDALVSALLGWTSVQSGLNPLKPEAFDRAARDLAGVGAGPGCAHGLAASRLHCTGRWPAPASARGLRLVAVAGGGPGGGAGQPDA